MTKISNVALLSVLLLAGCVSLSQDDAAWEGFIERTADLTPSEWNQTLKQSTEQYRLEPTDSHGVQLAYLLNRPTASASELQQSASIASGINPHREYAVIRSLLRREVDLIGELRGVRAQIGLLTEQLATLQTQVDLLNLAEAQRSAELEQVDTLRAQLDAIKTIEADMAKDKQTIEELSQ